MKKNTDAELDKKIESLIGDPDFSRRIASRILIQAAELKHEKRPTTFRWQMIAAAVLLGLGGIFAVFVLKDDPNSGNPYAGLSNPAAELIASPQETEYVWETTDSIIETSFGER